MDTTKLKKNAKLIGIGDEGIKNLDLIEEKIRHNMDSEKIALNQEVDKEYVRKVLDGLDVLILTYNSEDKRALQIVNAIGFMADERRVLSIGLDIATKENKDDVNLNRIFVMNDENIDELICLFNMMINAISDYCTINMDVTDLKEAIASDKGIKYSYSQFDKGVANEEIVETLLERTNQINTELYGKKQLILVEVGLNYCENEAEILMYINELLTSIQDKTEDTYEAIFTLDIKESLTDKIKIALVYN